MDTENTPFGVEFQNLSFRTLGDPKAVERINKQITTAIEAMHDEDAEAKKGVITAELTIKVTLQRVIDTNSFNIGIGCGVKLPAQKGSFQSGMTRGHNRVIVPLDDIGDSDRQTDLTERLKH